MSGDSSSGPAPRGDTVEVTGLVWWWRWGSLTIPVVDKLEVQRNCEIEHHLAAARPFLPLLGRLEGARLGVSLGGSFPRV